MQGDKKSMFDKQGSIGKQFQADGSIGSIGEAVGGPFSKEGGKSYVDFQVTSLTDFGGSNRQAVHC